MEIAKHEFRIGDWLADSSLCQIRRNGTIVHLRPKVMDLLVVLATHPGQVVSKQRLLDDVWQSEAIAESALTRTVTELRQALGDDTGQPRYIETIAKRGYRLIAHVEMSAEPQVSSSETCVAREPSDRRTSASPGWRSAGVAIACGTLIVIAVLEALLGRGGAARGEARRSPAVAVPLTAYPGFENAPSLSPDGSQVAFVWNGWNQQANGDIYVKLVGPGEPRQITFNPAHDGLPAWSPDGRTIAFKRLNVAKHNTDIYVVPALGGAETRLVADLSNNFETNIAWTPDSQWLAYSDDGDPAGIWLIAADGSNQRKKLIDAGANPAFSADGTRVALARFGRVGYAVYVLPLTGGFAPAGAALQVSSERPFIRAIAWTPDDRSLVFSSSGHLGASHLERIALDQTRLHAVGEPELLPFQDATAFSISRSGRLVYNTRVRDANLWRLTLSGSDRGKVTALYGSTSLEHTPDYSPDGKRIAYISTQSGSEEIWVAEGDGSHPVQMTTFGGPTCANPRWEPGSSARILFQATGHHSAFQLYVLSMTTGQVTLVTEDSAANADGSWSRNGTTIYFASDRTGRWEIWKMPAAGGPSIQLTTRGGVMPIESSDGRVLYYVKNARSGNEIWRVPAAGGDETRVVTGINDAANLAVAPNRLYFGADGPTLLTPTIESFELRSGQRTTLLHMNKAKWYGLALSPDQKYLLYSALDSFASNLMLVEHFQ